MLNAGYKTNYFFRFLLKRLARLEPPYIFSLLLVLAILFIKVNFMLSETPVHVSGKQILLHFGYLIPFFKNYHWLNQVYWTLAIEFQYYLLIAILFTPLIKIKIIGRQMVYLAILCLSLFAPEITIFYWLPVFLLGMLLFLYKSEIISGKEYYLASTLTIIFCLVNFTSASVIYALIPVAAILLIADTKITGLHFLGKFSYSIYLIHPVLGASLINILSHHFISPLSKFFVILSGIALTLCGAWITFALVEKPSKKLSAGISYK